MSDPLIDPRALVPDANLKVPDLSEATEGWRAWGIPAKIPPFGIAPKLHSVTHIYFWHPRRASRAECKRSTEHVPGEHCSCGFYSAKSLEHLTSMAYHFYDADSKGMFHVIGQVANWGKVIEGSQGWRAEYGYPLKLWVPYEAWELAEPLSEAYGVPVELKNTLGLERKPHIL